MWKFLKNSREILGINARNLLYIRGVNPLEAIKLARNKLATKQKLAVAGLPVPKTYAVIRNRQQLLAFDWQEIPPSFALKPNLGSGGEGIIIIFAKKDDSWLTSQNQKLKTSDLLDHISNILDGNFSIGNIPDIAFFEERLKIIPELKPYTFQGIPDVRVIVYNHIPIMAMMRLPTKASRGKANLHSGAVGVGIDLARGITTHAVLGNQPIVYHPDNQLMLVGIKIPHWLEILKLSIRSQEIIGLGYMGTDVTIDPRYGPIILEVNAHPGLNIQIANLTPLKERLRRVAGLKAATPEKGIRLAQNLFGSEYEQELEEKTGRLVIGPIEAIEILKANTTWKRVMAKIDTGADLTSVDTDLLEELGYKDSIKKMEELNLPTEVDIEEDDGKIKASYKNSDEIAIIQSSHGKTVRLKVPLTIKLSGQVMAIQATVVSREHLKYPIIIGRKNLKNFLVDPLKPI